MPTTDQAVVVSDKWQVVGAAHAVLRNLGVPIALVPDGSRLPEKLTLLAEMGSPANLLLIDQPQMRALLSRLFSDLLAAWSSPTMVVAGWSGCGSEQTSRIDCSAIVSPAAIRGGTTGPELAAAIWQAVSCLADRKMTAGI